MEQNSEEISVKKIKTPTFVIDYWNKVFEYSLKGFIIGGITSYLLIKRWKIGAIFGVGIATGYLNEDFMRIFRFYSESLNFKNLIKEDERISYNH